MHEYSIVQALLERVDAEADRRGATAVHRIAIRIGELSGVDVHLLQTAHFAEHHVLAVNLMGSPGAGKTAILEATARMAPGHPRLGALAGDLATDHDAARLQAAGIVAPSITTGSTCHLDAEMVHCLHEIPWRDLDYLFVENVGNLVCPAVDDLGQAVNVVALSVTRARTSR